MLELLLAFMKGLVVPPELVEGKLLLLLKLVDVKDY